MSDLPVPVIAGMLEEQLPVRLAITPDAAKMTTSFRASGEDGYSAVERFGLLFASSPIVEGKLVRFVPVGTAVERVAVLESAFVDANKLGEISKAVGGDGVQAVTLGDRVVVAGSRGSVLRAEDLAQIARAGVDGWLVEVAVFRVSDDWAEKSGVLWALSGGAAAEVGEGFGRKPLPGPIVGASARAAVSALYESSARRSGASLEMVSPLFVLEGDEASLNQGDEVPVPRKTVSDAGTVTTSGYDRIQTGFRFSVRAKRLEHGVLLRLRPELSSIAGFVSEEVPIVTKSTIDVSVVAEPDEWLVLGGLRDKRTSDSQQGLAFRMPGGPQKSATEAQTRVVFAVRASRVFSGGARP